MYRRAYPWAKLLAAIFLCLGLAIDARAQDDSEPNNSCTSPQIVGPAIAPFSIRGSITPPDVDFYRFTAPPGQKLVATVSDSLGRIGLFASSCSLLQDSRVSSDNRIDFTVPQDGIVILALTDLGDSTFSGNGFFAFAYSLDVRPAPPAIRAIQGRLVDAVSRRPLTGGVQPFATATLLLCTNGFCQFVSQQATDAQGQFRFERDLQNRPLPVGTYQVRGDASEFQPALTAQRAVAENATLDFGAVALIPPPILFSDVQPCTALLPQGGTCRYSVAIHNNTTARLNGLALSLVDGQWTGSTLNSTSFEASTTRTGAESVRRATVAVPPLESRVLSFTFDIPSFVRDGSTFCTRVLFGFNPSPLLNTSRSRDLFCITKGGTGFRTLSDPEMQRVLEQMRTRPPAARDFGVPGAPRR